MSKATVSRFLRFQFYGVAKQVEEAMVQGEINLGTSLKTLAQSITSAKIVANAMYPFFRIPNLEHLGQAVRDMAEVHFIGVTSEVAGDQVEEYNAFIKEDLAGWFNESLDVVKKTDWYWPAVQAGSSSSTESGSKSKTP